MKLKVNKRSDGNFEIELQTATDKKPQKLIVGKAEIDMLVQMLSAAREASTFSFQLEL